MDLQNRRQPLTLGNVSRRQTLQLMATVLGGAALVGKEAIAANRTLFGTAVALPPFRNDPILKQKLRSFVDLVVPMNALKWALLRPTRDVFDFSGADEIVDFAVREGKQVHGHTLLWYGYNPNWLENVHSESELEALLTDHIDKVVGRYAGRIATWDVVNEVVAHDPIAEGNWRSGIWYNKMGPRHVDIAFAAAARADPSARLFINDYDLEDDSPRTQARQEAILNIIRRLQDRNIPVHGVGLQAHLYAHRKIGRENLQKFLIDIKSLGLEVAITELDVIDVKLTQDEVVRDRLAVELVEEFLGAVTDVLTPRSIASWGLNDKYSWIQDTFPRPDGAQGRPLPFDSNWLPKPLFSTIRSFL